MFGSIVKIVENIFGWINDARVQDHSARLRRERIKRWDRQLRQKNRLERRKRRDAEKRNLHKSSK